MKTLIVSRKFLAESSLKEVGYILSTGTPVGLTVVRLRGVSKISCQDGSIATPLIGKLLEDQQVLSVIARWSRKAKRT